MNSSQMLRLLRKVSGIGACAGVVFLWLGVNLAAAAEPTGDRLDWSEPARLAEKSLLLDAARQGDRILAVGERGHILVSEDRGATWVQARVPTRCTLTGVALLEGGQAWAVGHDAVIVHTPDGGKTWTRQYVAEEESSPLLDVWFENPEHGLAIGAYALFLETRDGGKTWEQRTVDEEERHWNSIARAQDGSLFVAAESGAVFRSSDQGQTWESLTSPYAGSFFGALGLKDGSVLIFGLRGNVFRSTDRGQSWQHLETGTKSSLINGVQTEDGTAILVGLIGAVLVSRDGGLTFMPRNRKERQAITAVLEGPSQANLLFGEAGIVKVGDLNH